MKSETKPSLTDAFGGVDELIFWSYRYFMGRMTASTCRFAKRLAENWLRIDPRTRKDIQSDLESAFKADDEARANKENRCFFPLGNDCDRAAWQLVRDAYSKHTP